MPCKKIDLPTIPPLPTGISLGVPSVAPSLEVPDLCCKLPNVVKKALEKVAARVLKKTPGISKTISPAFLKKLNTAIVELQSKYIHARQLKCPIE